MTQLALDMPTGAWRLTGARGAACLPLPGAVPSLCAEWRDPQGGRVWLPCDPRPGCEGCAELAEHRCEPSRD